MLLQTSTSFGIQSVSQSTVSRLRNSVFRNVDVRKGGFNFSKCSECEHYKDLIDMSIKGSEERENLKRELRKHNNHQGSCRNLYHAWRHESKINPREVLAIIHDGMDTNKTAIPRLRVITKATAGLFQLPVSLTGMVTHGHGDGAYAHYATDLWPKDSNFTISSLARCLRALEKPPVRNSRMLFQDPPLNDYFDKLLWGKSR